MKMWLRTFVWKLAVMLGVVRLQPIPVRTEEQRRMAAQRRRR